MTNQVPDVLINEYAEVDFVDLYPYGIATGDIQSNHGWGEPYPFRNQPSPSREHSISFLWRGYISIYLLDTNGQLTLQRYEYPNIGEKRKPEIVNETMDGDFHLILKSEFESPRLYVPFRNGYIVSNQDEWIIEQE